MKDAFGITFQKWFGLKKIPRDFIYDVQGVFAKLPETRLNARTYAIVSVKNW